MTYKQSSDQPVGWSFLLSRRWLGYYVLIIIFSIACVLLGNWQFERRDEAQAEIARIDANYDAAPTPVGDALPTLESFENDANKWHPVILEGEYIGEPYIARNRAGQNGVGSLLVHPFLLGNGTLFFVDRGWVDVNASDGIPDALPMPANGPIEVEVRLRERETELDNRTNKGRTLGSLDMSVLAQEFSLPAYTGAYGQLINETPVGETGILPPKPERDEGPHLSYALQWYVFIIIVISGAWYAATLEYRSFNSDNPEFKEKMAKKSEKNKNRKLSDAEQEDAFLDA